MGPEACELGLDRRGFFHSRHACDESIAGCATTRSNGFKKAMQLTVLKIEKQT
jgi:hypothetical protein